MKIGFLFNHDQLHQVAHSLPVAASLARLHPEHEIRLLATSAALEAEIARLQRRLGATVPVERLELRHPLTRALASALDGLLPIRKLGIYGDQLERFRALDALVVAEKTSAILHTRYRLDRLVLIHTRHGAGDRANGFNRASARFDHVLAAGEKIRARLIADAGVPADRISVVGYPKFDLPPAPSLRERLFADPSRPVVLYNPHPSPKLSSWYRDGRRVLDWFVANPHLNLIFAPHVMLFARRAVLSIDPPGLAMTGRIARAVRDAPNIHVDLGSPSSTDMSYTNAADLYLGDVSSQVYEFLRTPRPCLFIDSHRTAWRDSPDYRHWQAGEVIEGAAALGPALDRAFALHGDWRPAQERLFAASFDLTDTPSSERAAEAVHRAALRGALP